MYILLVELANGDFQTKVNKLFEDGYQLRDSANFKYENGEVHIVQSLVLSERGIYREIEELVRSKVMDWKTAKETYNERCKSVGHDSSGVYVDFLGIAASVSEFDPRDFD